MTSKYNDVARLPHAQMKSAPNLPDGTPSFRPSTSVPRAIWPECGIDVSELKTTDIPHKIRVHGWGNFVFPRPPYNSEVVREFYAALKPETFKETGTVLVRGCQVVITAKLINKHFHTPGAPETDFILGLRRQEFFAKIDPGFSSALRWDKSNESRDLLYEELHPEMALWTMFINHSLIPSKIQTELSLEIAKILFSISRGLPIDIGHIIHEQICNAHKSASSLLPFPSLITHFCNISGVTVRENLCAPMADIGRESYNVFAQQQGLPTLPSTKQGQVPLPVQSKKRGQVPLPVQSQNGNVDRPKWVTEITGRLNSISDMMVGQYNALSAQINNLGMRVTSLEDAMRDGGIEHLLSSRRVRPRSTK